MEEPTLLGIVERSMRGRPGLSRDRADIERRLLFPAGEFTSAGPLLAPMVAALMTVGFYAVLTLFPSSAAVDMFTQRGVVQYVIMYFAFWSLAILAVKATKLRVQSKSLGVPLLPSGDPGFVLTPGSAEHVLRTLHESVDEPQAFFLTRRIYNALANLKNIGRVGDVDEVLRTQAESDEAVVESSYTILRGVIWAIPVLGFIGTVQGLSHALGSFWNVVAQAGKMEELRTALQRVTGGLATAFDTTLIGLVAALVIHLLMVMLKRREERFLDKCKDYCQRNIVGKLRLSPRDLQEQT